MAKRKTAAELEELAKIARAREAARKAARDADPAPYRPKVAADYNKVYYRDPLEIGRFLEIEVRVQSLTEWGGIAAAGLLDNPPEGAVVVPIIRGSKIPIIKVNWYYGDASVIVVPGNAAHGRWIKRYDERNGSSHKSIPFSIASGTFNAATVNINAIITAFNAKLDTVAKKDDIIGKNGRAELVLGYGTQYTKLASVKA